MAALAGLRVALLDTSERSAGASLVEAAAIIVALGAEFVSDLRQASIIVLRTKPSSRSAALFLRNLSKALPDAKIVRSEWLRECWRTRSPAPHASYLAPESLDEERIFAPVRICLGAFDDVRYRAYCASVLRANGALITEASQPPECTHVLLPYSVSRQSLQALARLSFVVTPFWIHDCVVAKKLVPIEAEKLHHPVANVSDMQGLRISCTIFDKSKREIIRRQALAAGAIPDFSLTKEHTHLLTPVRYDIHSPKCALAQSWGVHLVSDTWLSASLQAGRRLPEADFPPAELQHTIVFSSGSRPEASALAALAEMGADVMDSSESGVFPEGSILIMKKLRRSERFLAACASGCWILQPPYITDAVASKVFPDEAPYEWSGTETEAHSSIWLGAPRRWRLYHRLHPGGAFAGKKVIVLGELPHPPSSATVAAILRLAGAVTLSWPLQGDERPDFAIVAPVPDCEQAIAELASKGVPQFAPQSIADLFSHEKLPSLAQQLSHPLSDDL